MNEIFFLLTIVGTRNDSFIIKSNTSDKLFVTL